MEKNTSVFLPQEAAIPHQQSLYKSIQMWREEVEGRIKGNTIVGVPITFHDKDGIKVTITRDDRNETGETKATLFESPSWGMLAVVWHGQAPKNMTVTYIGTDNRRVQVPSLPTTTGFISSDEVPHDLQSVLNKIASWQKLEDQPKAPAQKARPIRRRPSPTAKKAS